MKLRRARKQDAAPIHQLIAYYARQGLLLPRSLKEISAHVSHFVVAERDGAIIGCAALEPYHGGLGELRSLAVAETERGHGTGAELVQTILRHARRRGMERVFAVTHAPSFFVRYGFARASEMLAEKIARDCIGCLRFGQCTLSTVFAYTNRISRPVAFQDPVRLPIAAS